MSKETGTGLLSKMAKFVRNPTTNWSDLDKLETGSGLAGNSMSKQALKEMVERKRRNDFVRKREFELLRKLRRREITGPEAAAGGADVPSMFPSSLPPEPVKRDKTLQKIDEIEKQMARQWFKGKTGAAPLAEAAGQGQTAPVTPSPIAFEPTQAIELPEAARVAPAPAPVAEPPAQFETMAPLEGAFAPEPVPAPEPAVEAQPVPASAVLVQEPTTVIDELVEDPELEEAAILFANGDNDAAEMVLRAMLWPDGARQDHVDTWLALFDLYRATGQQERYDDAAVQFAARFGRSAPQWFSLPDVLREAGLAVPIEEDASAAARTAHWTASSTVSRQNLATLATIAGRFAPPWRIDWRYMKAIEPAAIGPLAERLEAWAGDRGAQLQFIGTENLLAILADLTPTGDPQIDPQLWRLRLAVLRVLGEGEEFDLVALNYCITYEISPPAWEPPLSECQSVTTDGSLVAPAMYGAGVDDSQLAGPSSGLGALSDFRPSQLPDTAQLDMTGEIVGDATSKLGDLERVGTDAHNIEVTCERVLRVDFVAAGTLLNWATAQQAEGRRVTFTGVNRLVGAFFRVIGINDVARIALRVE